MNISRRGLFALPIAVPIALTMKSEQADAWTIEEANTEAAAFERRAREEAIRRAKKRDYICGCCIAWVEHYNAEFRNGYLRCSDGRRAFIHGDLTDYDPAVLVPGQNLFLYWRERANGIRCAEIIVKSTVTS